MEEIKEVKANTYKGKRYWVKITNDVKTVKMESYGETLLPSSLPTHSKEGKPNNNLIPFMNMLINNYKDYGQPAQR